MHFEDEKNDLLSAIEACREMLIAVDRARTTYPDLADQCNEIIKHEHNEAKSLANTLIELKREHAKQLLER